MNLREDNQNDTYTEQDARIVINRKLQEAGWVLEGPNKNVLINGLLKAKTKNARFEPESIVDTSSQNKVFVDVCPTLLRG